jgi:WhiB family transcriptional regulator, redox-sensing transcriptional regulator
MPGMWLPQQRGAERPSARDGPAFDTWDWMSRGACQGEDPELFFPIAVEGPALYQVGEAKEVCRRCAVCAMCLAYAVETRQAGVWGGTTWEERHAMMAPSRFPLNEVLGESLLNGVLVTTDPTRTAPRPARSLPDP